MAIVRVKYECRECPFVTTDALEAEEHADAERHSVKALGEIQPRAGLRVYADKHPMLQTSSRPQAFLDERRTVRGALCDGES